MVWTHVIPRRLGGPWRRAYRSGHFERLTRNTAQVTATGAISGGWCNVGYPLPLGFYTLGPIPLPYWAAHIQNGQYIDAAGRHWIYGLHQDDWTTGYWNPASQDMQRGFAMQNYSPGDGGPTTLSGPMSVVDDHAGGLLVTAAAQPYQDAPGSTTGVLGQWTSGGLAQTLWTQDPTLQNEFVRRTQFWMADPYVSGPLVPVYPSGFPDPVPPGHNQYYGFWMGSPTALFWHGDALYAMAWGLWGVTHTFLIWTSRATVDSLAIWKCVWTDTPIDPRGYDFMTQMSGADLRGPAEPFYAGLINFGTSNFLTGQRTYGVIQHEGTTYFPVGFFRDAPNPVAVAMMRPGSESLEPSRMTGGDEACAGGMAVYAGALWAATLVSDVIWASDSPTIRLYRQEPLSSPTSGDWNPVTTYTRLTGSFNGQHTVLTAVEDGIVVTSNTPRSRTRDDWNRYFYHVTTATWHVYTDKDPIDDPPGTVFDVPRIWKDRP